MRVLRVSLAALLGIALAPEVARAAVDIEVDLSSQTMEVSSSSGEHFVWPVSTARQGFRTPRGTYSVQSMAEMHYSRKYHNSPMPHSIFFKGGYAIHGSYETAALGRAASHGCIRLSPRNAATLYDLVEAEGAHITIKGSAPSDRFASRGERPSRRFRTSPDEQFDADPLLEETPSPDENFAEPDIYSD